MTRRGIKRIGGTGASLAAVAVLAAVPGAATASRGEPCGTVSAGDIGAKVTAVGVKCDNARRYVRRCFARGELESGWTVSVNERRGKLKLTKGDKKIVGLLEGGFTTEFKECVRQGGA